VLSALPPIRRIAEDRQRLRAENLRLQRRLQKQRQRLATARAKTAELTKQLKLERSANVTTQMDSPVDAIKGYLFVVTYGRSGSTLLQGVLNSIDGYQIRGENREALFHLYRYHSTLESESHNHTRSQPLTPRDAWFGIDKYDPEHAREELRRLVTATVFQPSAGTRITGFKEIRWWHKEWDGYFTFLINTFPNARFVINSRRFDDVAKSKWWSKMEDPRARMDFFNDRLSQIEAKLGDRAYRISYDDYIANPDRLKGLFDWLGEPFDRSRVDAVLALKHSS